MQQDGAPHKMCPHLCGQQGPALWVGSARGQPGLAEVGLRLLEKSVSKTPGLRFVLEERLISSQHRDERLHEKCLHENTSFRPLNLPMVLRAKLRSTHIMSGERVPLTASKLLVGLPLGKMQIFNPNIFLKTTGNCGQGAVLVLSAAQV